MVAGSAATCCVACCPPRRRPPDWRRPPTRSPASTYGCRHSVRWSAFSWLRSISYSTPSRPNRKVPTAGEPSRSSVSSTTSRRAIRLQSAGTHASMHVATRQSPAAFDLGPKITSRWPRSPQPSSASSNSTPSTTTLNNPSTEPITLPNALRSPTLDSRPTSRTTRAILQGPPQHRGAAAALCCPAVHRPSARRLHGVERPAQDCSSLARGLGSYVHPDDRAPRHPDPQRCKIEEGSSSSLVAEARRSHEVEEIVALTQYRGTEVLHPRLRPLRPLPHPPGRGRRPTRWRGR